MAPGKLGRDGDHGDTASGGRLPAPELADVGRPDVTPRVRAAGSVLGRDVRPFDMDARHAGRDERVGITGVSHGSNGVRDVRLGLGADGDERARHAMRPECPDRARGGLRAGARIVGIVSAEAVHLDVQPARGDPRVIGCLDVMFDRGHMSVSHHDAHGTTVRHVPAHELGRHAVSL